MPPYNWSGPQFGGCCKLNTETEKSVVSVLYYENKMNEYLKTNHSSVLLIKI